MAKVRITDCCVIKGLPSYEVLIEGMPEVTTSMQVGATDIHGQDWTHEVMLEKGHREWGDEEDGGIELVNWSPRLNRFVDRVKKAGCIETDFWHQARFPCEVFSDRPDFY